MTRALGLVSLLLVALLCARVPAPAAAPPEGQLTWAVAVSVAPAWFDPAEATGILTPFMIPR
jgi:peptide/nickel transport system substrate-binding protein